MKTYTTSRFILFFAYYIVALQAHSQRSISGQVQESHGKPLAYANNLPFTMASWWQMQNNLMGVWQKSMTLYQGEPIMASILYARINSTQTFTLPYNFTAELTWFYQTASLHGTYVLKAFGSLTAGLQKKFNDDKVTLRLSVDDLFWTNRFAFTNANFDSHFDIDIGFILNHGWYGLLIPAILVIKM